MSMPARLAAAAVIGAVILGGALLALGGGGRSSGIVPIATSSPSPTASTSPIASASPAAQVDYSDIGGRILVEHLGNAIDGSEMPTTDYHPERRRFYFMDPATMTGATAVEFLPGQPVTGKTAADISHDGTKIVFQDFTEEARLYEANLDGTGFRKIPDDCASTCDLLYPDYDPTAAKIVYVRVEGGQSWLEIRNLTTNKVTKLEATVGSGTNAVPEQPAWSPDGKTIAFSRLTWPSGEEPVVGTIHYGDKPPTSGVLSLLNVATGKVTDLTLPAGNLPGDANWSPDSSVIVFTSGPASTTGSNAGMADVIGGAWRIDADGTDLASLTGWGGLEFLPDGQHILGQNNTMWMMGPDGSDPRPVNVNAMDLSELETGFAYIGHWIADSP